MAAGSISVGVSQLYDPVREGIPDRVQLSRFGIDKPAAVLGLIDNWTKPGCGGRAETEYEEVQ